MNTTSLLCVCFIRAAHERADTESSSYNTQACCDVTNRGVNRQVSLCTEAKCCLYISHGATPSLPRKLGAFTQKPSIGPVPEPVNIPTTQFHVIHFSIILPLSSWSSKGTFSVTFFYKNSVLTSLYDIYMVYIDCYCVVSRWQWSVHL
jgi:hypothetical protein